MSKQTPPPEIRPMEGWGIAARPLLVGMLAIIVILASVLTVTGWRYRETIRPATHPRVHHYPAPTLDGFDNPAKPSPGPPPPGQSPPLSNAALGNAAARGNALLQDAAK